MITTMRRTLANVFLDHGEDVTIYGDEEESQ